MPSVRLRRTAAIRLLWSLRPLRASAAEIGRGLAVGTLVAFTPTVGLQTVLAAVLATLVGGSRAAAILPVWISNPLTFPIVYVTTYRVGRWFWPGRTAEGLTGALEEFLASLQVTDPWDVAARVSLLLSLGSEMAIPLWLGGILVGSVAAVAAYALTVGAIAAARATLRRRPRLGHPARRSSGPPPPERLPLQ